MKQGSEYCVRKKGLRMVGGSKEEDSVRCRPTTVNSEVLAVVSTVWSLGRGQTIVFHLLFQEMEKEIKNVFRNGNQDEVLSEAFRLTITRKDIQTLNHLNWLNDEVILHLLYIQIVNKY